MLGGFGWSECKKVKYYWPYACLQACLERLAGDTVHFPILPPLCVCVCVCVYVHTANTHRSP